MSLTERALRSFVKYNSHDIDWRDENLYLWIGFDELEDFARMLSPDIEDQLMINLQKDCVAIKLDKVCEINGIDPERILKKSVQDDE